MQIRKKKIKIICNPTTLRILLKIWLLLFPVIMNFSLSVSVWVLTKQPHVASFIVTPVVNDPTTAVFLGLLFIIAPLRSPFNATMKF